MSNQKCYIFRSVKFRIRTWYVYKEIHLCACIFEANVIFMHWFVYRKDIKGTNGAVKTCDYIFCLFFVFFEDLRRFSGISAISRLGSRR